MKREGVRLVAASPAHILPLSRRLRAEDLRECGAGGRTGKQALRLALRSSLWALTATVDGKPHAMMGVSPVSIVEDRGNPWFLGSDAVFDHGRAMLEWAPMVLDRMHGDFQRLENVVSTSNVRAIRLLRRWGFMIEEEPFTVRDVEFVRFWRVVDV